MWMSMARHGCHCANIGIVPDTRILEGKSIRMLQISDLHFGNHDPNAWSEVVKLVERLARDEKLDYIVVTGDLQNHFFADVAAVKVALGSIEKHCGRLLVIPGNHDYLVFGLLDRRVVVSLMAIAALVAITLPGILWPALAAAALAGSYLWFPQFYFRKNYKKWWDGRKVILENGLLLALFDSNSIWSSWARGRIGGRQLDWLASELAKLKASDGATYKNAVKIALMHHHPLPIVRPEKPMVIVPGRKVEKMLLLDDASEVLRSLADAGFDVILHGHKHRAAASRLTTEFERGGVTRQMLVVACGTSCLKDEAPFSANLLTVLPTRHVVLDRFFTDDPAVSAPFESTEPMLVPTRCIEADAAAIGYATRKTSYSFDIDEDGDAQFVQDIVDIEPTRYPPEALGKFGVKSPSGTLHDAKFTSSQLKVKMISTTNSGIEYEFLPWSEPRGRSASGRFSYWMMGSWVLNDEQARLVHGPDVATWAGCYVILKRPTDSFEISVQLPGNCRPEKPRLKFFTLKESTPVPELDRILESGLLWSRERNFIGVKLPNPPLGVYGVIWDLPAAPAAVISDFKAHSQAKFSWESLRRDFLAMRSPDASADLKRLAEDVRFIMESIGPMLAVALGEEPANTDRFEASLMIYDPTPIASHDLPGLSIVSHNRNTDNVTCPRLPVGTGMAGRACKTGTALVYNAGIGATMGKKPIPYLKVDGQKQHEVLYSLPIPSSKDPSLWTGVVLNIGAYQNGGPLLPGKGENWDTLVQKIGAQVPAIRRLLAEAWSSYSKAPFAG